jgi:hypothetical protein
VEYQHPAVDQRDKIARGFTLEYMHDNICYPDLLSVHVLSGYGQSDKHVLFMYADMEYDHLDYSRPGTSWKPHYQRMANGFEPHSKDTTNKDRSDNTD